MTDVPKLALPFAAVCAILNVGLAGSGTFLAGCLEKKAWNKTQMVVGWLQLLTSAYLVGWIMSIYWSYLIGHKALKGDERAAMFMDPKNQENLKKMAENAGTINAAFEAQNKM